MPATASVADLAVGAPCWVPAEADGFARCTVHAIQGDNISVKDASSQLKSLPATEVQPCNPDNQIGCKDNTELMCAPALPLRRVRFISHLMVMFAV